TTASTTRRRRMRRGAADGGRRICLNHRRGNAVPNITVKLKNGQVKRHDEKGRPGGSYTNRLTFDGAFAIVTDEYGNQTCYPAADIEVIDSQSTTRGGW